MCLRFTNPLLALFRGLLDAPPRQSSSAALRLRFGIVNERKIMVEYDTEAILPRWQQGGRAHSSTRQDQREVT